MTSESKVHSVANEISTLNEIRLSKDLSVQALASRIGIERSALHRLLFTPGREPRDRTLYKIRQFLEKWEREKREGEKRTRPTRRRVRASA